MDNLIRIFLEGLNRKMQDEYNPSDVAKYAYEFYLDYDIENNKLEYVVNYIKGMDAAPEFELNKEELIDFIKEQLY